MVPTLQSMIDDTFKKEVKTFEKNGKHFKIGDMVLAKMSGYGPWPSRVDGFTKNGLRAKCYFYGSNNNGSVDTNRMIPFEDASEIIRLINIRNPIDFAKGVREIEILNGIPHELSALRAIEPIQ